MNVRALALLFVANFLITSEFWSLFLSMPDEAISLLGAQRWLDGEAPYRDWDSKMPPGSYVLTLLWCGVCGFSSPSPRIFASLISACTSIAIHRSAERLIPDGGWRKFLPWTLWSAAGLLEFPILNYHWMATCAVAWSLYHALVWICDQSSRAAGWMGLCTALAGWILQSEGLAALGIVLVLSLRFRRLPPRAFWLALIGASLVLWIPVFLYWRDALPQIFGLGPHLSYNRNPYSWRNLNVFLSHYRGMTSADGWLTLLTAWSHCWANLLRYGAFPLVLVAGIIGFERSRDTPARVVGWAVLAWFLALSNRLTVLYFSFLGPGWVLLFSAFLRLLPGGRAWMLLVAVVEVAGWATRAVWRQGAFTQPIQTRRGTYYSLNANQAAGYAQISAWLQPLAPGTQVLALPYGSDLYVLFKLRNPIPEPVLVPLLYPPERFARARAILEQKRTEWILVSGLDTAGIAEEYPAASAAELQRSWEEERSRLTAGYTLVQGSPDLGLYRRVP